MKETIPVPLPVPPPAIFRLRRCAPWIALLIILLLTSAIRFRLLAAPLERDEGEYAYAAQLLLEGVAPYTQVYSMKMPGIYAIYALILAVFGQSQSAVHMGLLLVNAGTVILLFLLARRLFNPLTGVAAAAALALLSLGQFIHGIHANAEHFVLPFVLGGILLLLRALDDNKWWILIMAALMLGSAFLMKQHSAAFIVFAVLFLVYHQLRSRSLELRTFAIQLTVFCVSILLPFAVACGILNWAGAFDKFWFWTFSYAREYASALPLSEGIERYFLPYSKKIIQAAPLLWLLAGIGLTSLFWNRKNRAHWVFVTGLVLFSLGAICPGFFFRPHYFMLLMPAAALLVGLGVAAAAEFFRKDKSAFMARGLPLVMALIVLLQAVYQQRDFFFRLTPDQATRITFGINPFAESLEVARFLGERSAPDDKIAVLGSEPQIFFYTGCRSATSYVYTYEMVKKHRYASEMQQEMFRQIEAARAKFLIVVSIASSWMNDPGRDIREWYLPYQQENYQLIGRVEIRPYPRNSVYNWDQEARDHVSRSKAWQRTDDPWLEIYRRNDDQ